MALQVEQAVDGGVGAQESLRLLGRTEVAQATLPGPGFDARFGNRSVAMRASR